MNRRNGKIGFWLVIGTVLQLAMVISGHWVSAIAQGFAIGGVAISLIAGAGFGASGVGTIGRALGSGAMVGGLCALLGIALSCALGDVEPVILALGTASSAIAGLIGGGVARGIVGPGARSTTA